MTSMTANGAIPRVNGALRVTGPMMPLQRLEAVPAPPPPAAEPLPGAGPRAALSAAVVSALRAATGDTVITWAMAATVALVAVDAAIVSYSHIYGLATGQPGSGAETGIQARLLPLSIDGLILEASLVKMFAARHKLAGKTRLATCMLWLGIAATVAANVVHGLPTSLLSHVARIVIMAALSAWPAGALIGSVEMAMGLVRSQQAVASGRDSGQDSGQDSGSDTGGDSGRDTAPGAASGNDDTDSTGNGPAQEAGARRRVSRKPPADPVEAAIRRGWDDARVVARTGVSLRTVQRRRAAIDATKKATPSGPA